MDSIPLSLYYNLIKRSFKGKKKGGCCWSREVYKDIRAKCCRTIMQTSVKRKSTKLVLWSCSTVQPVFWDSEGIMWWVHGHMVTRSLPLMCFCDSVLLFVIQMDKWG